MTTGAPRLRVRNEAGTVRDLRLYDSSRPQERAATVYMVKTLPDGVRLAFDRDYKLLGSVQATPAEWEAALIHSLDSWAKYSLNDRVCRATRSGSRPAAKPANPTAGAGSKSVGGRRSEKAEVD